MIRAIFPRVGNSFDRFLYEWLHLTIRSTDVPAISARDFAQHDPSLLS
jgi:hypothetical protein